MNYLLSASLTATAQATVIPTMGFLPTLSSGLYLYILIISAKQVLIYIFVHVPLPFATPLLYHTTKQTNSKE